MSTYRYESIFGASRRAWLPGFGWASPGAVLSLSDDQAATVTLGRGESLVRLDPPDGSAAVGVSEPEPAVEAPASPLPVEPAMQAEPAPSDTPPETPAESPADVEAPKRTRRRRR